MPLLQIQHFCALRHDYDTLGPFQRHQHYLNMGRCVNLLLGPLQPLSRSYDLWRSKLEWGTHAALVHVGATEREVV